MFSPPYHRWTRRGFLRVGTLGFLGVTLPQVLHPGNAANARRQQLAHVARMDGTGNTILLAHKGMDLRSHGNRTANTSRRA